MPRKPNADLMKDWKIPLPAVVAGAVEFELINPVTGKPRYGERSKLIAHLLREWLVSRGKNIRPLDEPPSQDLIQ